MLVSGEAAHAEKAPNKPYKVCPEIVQAKDTPCRRQRAESTTVVRLMESDDPRDRKIAVLNEQIKKLEELLEICTKSSIELPEKTN